MADFDPIGEHDKLNKGTSEWPDTGENILLIPGGIMGGSSWEPEQETLFEGEKTQERRLTDSYVHSLYKELSKHYS